MSSDGIDRQGHCYPGSHPCFCGEDFPSELVWEEGWIDIKVYTFLDDVTRICCNIKLGFGDNLRGSHRSLEQLKISFVHCSSESHFLRADFLVENCCIELKSDVFYFSHIVYHILGQKSDWSKSSTSPRQGFLAFKT